MLAGELLRERAGGVTTSRRQRTEVVGLAGRGLGMTDQEESHEGGG
jgi:hypothetical protein